MRHRLFDAVIGCVDDACEVPVQPVRFGQRGWLAQHRGLESALGIGALLAVGWLYVLGFVVLSTPAAVATAAMWLVFTVGAVVMRNRRPCTVLRMPIHLLAVWIMLVAASGPLGIGSSG